MLLITFVALLPKVDYLNQYQREHQTNRMEMEATKKWTVTLPHIKMLKEGKHSRLKVPKVMGQLNAACSRGFDPRPEFFSL